jgi:energy-coupling factor transporter ATP-binding protein EcfA2
LRKNSGITVATKRCTLQPVNTPLITSIRVEGLFGLYTYDLPREGSFADAAILYGDNGAGKTTILRLVFHMLSAADNRSHRTALYEAPFESFEVRLGSGISVTAKRVGDSPKSLRLAVLDGSRTLADWDYKPRRSADEERETLRETLMAEILRHSQRTFSPPLGSSLGLLPESDIMEMENPKLHGETAYLAALKEHAPTVFILNAERRLDSDTIERDDEMAPRLRMDRGQVERIQDIAQRVREISVSEALAAAVRWISKQALQGANKGSTNVHSVYGEVLHHLISVPATKSAPVEPPKLVELTNRLNAIEKTTTKYAQYELTTPLSMTEFCGALTSPSTQILLYDILEPYARSLESRLEALDPIYSLVHRFVSTVNAFLSDKSIWFRPSAGFTISNKLGSNLEPAQLSSGEQQLLLLLCYALTGRDRPSVFMIDEPEISLNIKWQRQLVQSLLDLTQEADTQFIFASHSMELLAQHRSRVVKLVEAR